MDNFSCVSSFVITAYPFISLPVAANVRIANTGSASVISLSLWKYSHTSTSDFAPTAMAFPSSSTEPPPTAKTASTFSFLAFSIPSLVWLSTGLGFTPPCSIHWMPFSFKLDITLSYKPIFLIDD